MTTIINTPPSGENSNSVAIVAVGILLAVIAIVLFFVYVLPAIQGNEDADTNGIDINVNLPDALNPDDSSPTPAPSGNTNPY